MQNTLKHQREGYDITVTSCQRCIDTDLQCKREKYERKSRENSECIPGFFALISASTTRGATQCQRSIMTRGSQPVSSAARCSVTKHKQSVLSDVFIIIPSTSSKLEGPISFLVHAKYSLQRLVCTRTTTPETLP